MGVRGERNLQAHIVSLEPVAGSQDNSNFKFSRVPQLLKARIPDLSPRLIWSLALFAAVIVPALVVVNVSIGAKRDADCFRKFWSGAARTSLAFSDGRVVLSDSRLSQLRPFLGKLDELELVRVSLQTDRVMINARVRKTGREAPFGLPLTTDVRGKRMVFIGGLL